MDSTTAASSFQNHHEGHPTPFPLGHFDEVIKPQQATVVEAIPTSTHPDIEMGAPTANFEGISPPLTHTGRRCCRAKIVGAGALLFFAGVVVGRHSGHHPHPPHHNHNAKEEGMSMVGRMKWRGRHGNAESEGPAADEGPVMNHKAEGIDVEDAEEAKFDKKAWKWMKKGGSRSKSKSKSGSKSLSQLQIDAEEGFDDVSIAILLKQEPALEGPILIDPLPMVMPEKEGEDAPEEEEVAEIFNKGPPPPPVVAGGKVEEKGWKHRFDSGKKSWGRHDGDFPGMAAGRAVVPILREERIEAPPLPLPMPVVDKKK